MESSDLNKSQNAKDNLKSTKASLFFKATGRDAKPNWGNRIVKDFYDLDYNISGNLLKTSNKFYNTQKIKLKKYRQNRAAKGKILQNHKNQRKNKSVQLYRNESKSRKTKPFSIIKPQRIQIGPIESEPSKVLGLCKFQYDKTIQGRMQKRSLHHLSFQKNKVNRINNINTIYYRKQEDIDFSSVQKIEQRTKLLKNHPFQSYTERKVFQPREQLDKFYNTDRGRRFTSSKNVKQSLLQFDALVERKEFKKGESSTLFYDTIPCKQKIEQKVPNYSMPVSPRKFQFYPQVISASRGCFR